MYYPKYLENSLDKTLTKIHKSAKKAGRNPNNINIVAVTKTLPVEAWNDASRAHLDIIGENRVQEAQEKFQKYSNSLNMHLHLIGHLQSNKVNTAVKLFDVIQTIDSIKLAEKINKEAPINRFKNTATRIVFCTPIHGISKNPAKNDPIIVPTVLKA